MTKRVYVDKGTPSVFKAMNGVALEIAARATDVELGRVIMELVNVRVSQINQCLFCLDLHSRRAVEAGESNQRIAVLPAWRESTLFSEQERAALEIAEAVTKVATEHIDDDTYGAARSALSDDQISVLIWAAITINAFNRVSILSGHPVSAAPR
ncbi:carboxymuconolactone decarboxylase family protein [Rhodococcus sp. NPDC058521]|uniref:carboxymuconolactone decarboxylase family protein n=1 Tax=Rhodococcus sp. NPDC058521 TaxID=3346536 RepID=UPI003665BEBA